MCFRKAMSVRHGRNCRLQGCLAGMLVLSFNICVRIWNAFLRKKHKLLTLPCVGQRRVGLFQAGLPPNIFFACSCRLLDSEGSFQAVGKVVCHTLQYAHCCVMVDFPIDVIRFFLLNSALLIARCGKTLYTRSEAPARIS